MRSFALLAGLMAVAQASPKPQLLPPPVDRDRFKLYNMPTAFAGPCDLETGSDGHIYVSDQLTNKIAEVVPETGEVFEYDIPWTLPLLEENPLDELTRAAGINRLNLACVVRMGSDGNLYAANGQRNQLVQFNIQTKDITVLDPPGLGPLGNLQPFNDLWTGPDGMYFTQTTGNVLTYYEYSTGQFTNHQIPTPLSGPVGVFVASDNNVHISLMLSNKLAKFIPSTQEIIEYDIPSVEIPVVTRAETDGRYVWHTGFVGSSLIRYDIETDEVKVYKTPIPLSFPTENTADPNGNVWISTFFQNNMLYLTPSTGKWTQIAFPDALTVAPIGLPPGPNVAVHYDQRTDSIWFSQEVYNRVGAYKLDGSEGR